MVFSACGKSRMPYAVVATLFYFDWYSILLSRITDTKLDGKADSRSVPGKCVWSQIHGRHPTTVCQLDLPEGRQASWRSWVGQLDDILVIFFVVVVTVTQSLAKGKLRMGRVILTCGSRL